MSFARLSRAAIALLATAQIALPSPLAATDDVKSGAFTVAPLRIDLGTAQEATQLRIANGLDREAAVQLRVFEWSQAGGKDHYRPSEDFALSPSIVRIPSGAAQFFHLVRQRPFEPGEERRYRVVIDQLPDPRFAIAGGAATRLQITLPLFVGSEEAAPADIAAELADGELLLRNRGGRTVRVSSISLQNSDGSSRAIALRSGRYILGQSQLSYALPPGGGCQDAGFVRLHAVIDRNPIDVPRTRLCP